MSKIQAYCSFLRHSVVTYLLIQYANVMRGGNTGEIAVEASADGRIVSEWAPATHVVLKTQATVAGPLRAFTGRHVADTSDTIVPVLTATEQVARHVLDKRKALPSRGTPGTLIAISDTPRTVVTSVTPHTHPPTSVTPSEHSLPSLTHHIPLSRL